MIVMVPKSTALPARHRRPACALCVLLVAAVALLPRALAGVGRWRPVSETTLSAVQVGGLGFVRHLLVSCDQAAAWHWGRAALFGEVFPLEPSKSACFGRSWVLGR